MYSLIKIMCLLSSVCITAARDKLTDVEFRRARHVISEIERTQKASELLKQGDYTGYGKLMNDSHESLRCVSFNSP